MRIQKHAAKLLLGSANCIEHSPSPPPPPASPPPVVQCRSAEGGGLFLCQLNCSPWDVNVMDSDARCHFYFQQADEEEEDGEKERRGIMGNVLWFGDGEGVLGISKAVTTTATSSVVPEPYIDYEDKDETGLKKRRRRYKKDNSDVGVGRAICKKNDGKGWHCNRPANPHHNLCDHHLTQLKSYSSTRYNNNSSSNRGEAAAGTADVPRLKNHKKPDVPQVKHRRPKSSVTSHRSAGGGGHGGGYYYYYSGFGPSRGKSRGDEDAKLKEESQSAGGGSNAPIAGEDDDDDSDDGDDTNDGNVEVYKAKIKKKRGRKPIKARSLKSLL